MIGGSVIRRSNLLSFFMLKQNLYISADAFSIMEEGLLKIEGEKQYSFKEYLMAAFSNTGDIMKRIAGKPKLVFFLAIILVITAISAISSYVAYTRIKVNVIWPENISEEMRSLMEYGIQLSTSPVFIALTSLLVIPIVYVVGAIIIWIIGLTKAKISSVLTAMGIIAIPSMFSNIFKTIASALSPIRELTIDLRGGKPAGMPTPNYADILIDIVFLPWEAYLIYQLFRSGMGASTKRSILSVIIAEAIKYVWVLAGYVGLRA